MPSGSRDHQAGHPRCAPKRSLERQNPAPQAKAVPLRPRSPVHLCPHPQGTAGLWSNRQLMTFFPSQGT